MTPAIAARLVSRLRGAGYFLDAPGWVDRPDTDDANSSWLLKVPPAELPFLPAERIAAEAKKVGSGVLSQLYLGKMPTETDVAQATVFFLADRAVSGETFMPSGGLSVERSTTERELFGGPNQERLDQMRGRVVWIIGEHLVDFLAETARQFMTECHVAKVILLTRSDAGFAAVRDALADIADAPLESVLLDDGVQAAMDRALLRWGRPTTILSTPLEALPTRLFESDALLTPDEFRAVVANNLTAHFLVARKASLYDDCQLVLASPDVPMGDKAPLLRWPISSRPRCMRSPPRWRSKTNGWCTMCRSTRST